MQLPVNTVAAKLWEIPVLLGGQNFENNKNKKKKEKNHSFANKECHSTSIA